MWYCHCVHFCFKRVEHRHVLCMFCFLRSFFKWNFLKGTLRNHKKPWGILGISPLGPSLPEEYHKRSHMFFFWYLKCYAWCCFTSHFFLYITAAIPTNNCLDHGEQTGYSWIVTYESGQDYLSWLISFRRVANTHQLPGQQVAVNYHPNQLQLPQKIVFFVQDGPLPGHNPYKWPSKWVTGVITLLLGAITPFATGRGPSCVFFR